MAIKTIAVANEETRGLPRVEIVRLADREPAAPSEERVRQTRERLRRSPFFNADD